jgi:hypothetical protein
VAASSSSAAPAEHNQPGIFNFVSSPTRPVLVAQPGVSPSSWSWSSSSSSCLRGSCAKGLASSPTSRLTGLALGRLCCDAPVSGTRESEDPSGVGKKKRKKKESEVKSQRRVLAMPRKPVRYRAIREEQDKTRQDKARQDTTMQDKIWQEKKRKNTTRHDTPSQAQRPKTRHQTPDTRPHKRRQDKSNEVKTRQGKAGQDKTMRGKAK